MGSYGASGLDRSHIAAQRFGVTGPVWMAGIIVGSAVVLMVLGLLVPGAHMENLPEKLVAIGLGVVQVAILVVLRRRTPMGVLWGILATYTVTAAVLVATAPTAIGALSFVFGPVAVGVFAGVWGSRAIAASMFGIILVSGTVALAASGRLGEVLYVWAGFVVLCLGVIVLLQLVVAELTRNAVVDPLTGLLNRRGLTGAISGAAGGAGPTSVVIIDVDDFKKINDGAGHDQGDRVLCDLAEHWSRGIRRTDTVARLGGDEFVMVLRGTDAEAAQSLLRRLRGSSHHPWSFGVEEWAPGRSFDEALTAADARLLEMKRARPQR